MSVLFASDLVLLADAVVQPAVSCSKAWTSPWTTVSDATNRPHVTAGIVHIVWDQQLLMTRRSPSTKLVKSWGASLRWQRSYDQIAPGQAAEPLSLAQTWVPGSHIRLQAFEAASILLCTQQPCMSD